MKHLHGRVKTSSPALLLHTDSSILHRVTKCERTSVTQKMQLSYILELPIHLYASYSQILKNLTLVHTLNFIYHIFDSMTWLVSLKKKSPREVLNLTLIFLFFFFFILRIVACGWYFSSYRCSGKILTMVHFCCFQVPFRQFSFSLHDNRHALQDEGEYFGNVSEVSSSVGC